MANLGREVTRWAKFDGIFSLTGNPLPRTTYELPRADEEQRPAKHGATRGRRDTTELLPGQPESGRETHDGAGWHCEGGGGEEAR